MINDLLSIDFDKENISDWSKPDPDYLIEEIGRYEIYIENFVISVYEQEKEYGYSFYYGNLAGKELCNVNDLLEEVRKTLLKPDPKQLSLF